MKHTSISRLGLSQNSCLIERRVDMLSDFLPTQMFSSEKFRLVGRDEKSQEVGVKLKLDNVLYVCIVHCIIKRLTDFIIYSHVSYPISF
jgi:hypothetical protein